MLHEINYDLTNEEYHTMYAEYFSASFSKKAWLEGLYHAKNSHFNISAEAKAKGDGVHAATLEAEKDLLRRGTNRRGTKEWKELEANAYLDGKILLKDSEYDEVMLMAKSLMDSPTCSKFLKHPERICESSVFALHPSGVKMRCRPDLYIERGGIACDVKTCVSVVPKKWLRDSMALAYPIQAAWYKIVLELAGLPVNEFHFLCVQKSYPYTSQLYTVSDELMDWGIQQVNKVLLSIKEAQETNTWSTGWGDQVMMELPAYLKGDEVI